MSQLSLLEPPPTEETPAEPKLPPRQQAVLDALRANLDGLEASEVGAIAHELKEGRWAHSRDQRCDYCPRDGKAILEALAKKNLARYVRGRRLWYLDQPLANPQPEPYPPDFEGIHGTYNALPAAY